LVLQTGECGEGYIDDFKRRHYTQSICGRVLPAEWKYNAPPDKNVMIASSHDSAFLYHVKAPESFAWKGLKKVDKLLQVIRTFIKAYPKPDVLHV
jgi:hypothetical protein